MAVDVTIISAYRNPNYFDDLNPQSAYPYYASSPPVTIPAHNQLPLLQGGITNEYYHLEAAEHTNLVVWAAQKISS